MSGDVSDWAINGFDVGLMIPDERLSIDEGAIGGNGLAVGDGRGQFYKSDYESTCGRISFQPFYTVSGLSAGIRDIIIHGTNGHSVKVHYRGQRGEGVYDIAFEGLIRNMQKRYRETGSDTMKQQYEEFMQITPCKACKVSV